MLTHDQKVLATVSEASRELAGMFMDVLASVQFQDITRQQIEIVANALSKLDGHMESLAERIRASEAGDFNYVPLAQHLDALYSNYVMDKQRANHDEALNRPGGHATAAPAANKIELF